MLNKKGLALLLSLLVAVAAMPQEDANRSLWNTIDGVLSTVEDRLAPPPRDTSEESPSFTIVNLTSFTAREIFIRRAGETGWGRNLLDQPLHHRRNISVGLDRLPDPNALYDVRLVDTDGDVYAQYGLAIRDRTVIRIGIGDLEYNK